MNMVSKLCAAISLGKEATTIDNTVRRPYCIIYATAATHRLGLTSQ